MSNQEHSSNNPTSSAPEQIQHSGVHGYEKPVREFDKTSLAEATEQGLIETPDTIAPLVGKAEKQDFPTWAKYVIGSVATSIILGGGAVAYQMKRANDFVDGLNDALNNPTASARAVPGEVQHLPENVGVKLTADQLAVLKGGDIQARMKVYDTVLNGRLGFIIRDMANGRLSTSSADATSLIENEAVQEVTSEPEVVQAIQAIAKRVRDDIVPAYGYDEVVTTVCYANEADAKNGACVYASDWEESPEAMPSYINVMVGPDAFHVDGRTDWYPNFWVKNEGGRIFLTAEK